MSRMRIVSLAIGALALVAMIVVLVVAGGRRDGTPPGSAPAQHLRFDLTDHHGKPFTERDIAGRFALVYFGYTFCPDICPTELGFIHRLFKELGPQGEGLVPLFITIDPARDTVAVLADYVPLFDRRIVGLTGTPEAIAAAAASVGAFFQRADVVTKQPGFYLMDHSLSTYLVGPDGGVVARYDSHDPIAQTLADLRRRLAASPESP